jgi:transposase
MPHQVYWGLDRHARTLSLCLVKQDGAIVLHRTMTAAPEPCLPALAPYQEDLVVCVEGLFTWDWLADLCAREGLPCVRGHALSMNALHGGNAENDRLDAQQSAVLLRGGRLPQASVSPAERRATRDRLRRRMHFRRHRAEFLTHGQQTHRQYHRPELGKTMADKASRGGVAARVPPPAVQKSLDGELALMGPSDHPLRDVELAVRKTATPHHAHTRYLLRTVPGIGESLRLVLRYDIHPRARFPRVQEFASYCRLVTGAKEAAGTRYGTPGAKSGNASRNWAVSEAAVLVLRNNPAGPNYLARLAKQHGQGQALTALAQKLARAV